MIINSVDGATVLWAAAAGDDDARPRPSASARWLGSTMSVTRRCVVFAHRNHTRIASGTIGVGMEECDQFFFPFLSFAFFVRRSLCLCLIWPVGW